MKLKDFKYEYNTYFDIYLKRLNIENNCFALLEKNQNQVVNFFSNISDDKMEFTYRIGKWSISQILQHITDTERIFCYRALKIVREENPKIEAYDHEHYADTYKNTPKDMLLDDYKNNRAASISLFRTFDRFDLNEFIDDNHYKFMVGLIPFIFCGHELHHLDIIKKKYL